MFAFAVSIASMCTPGEGSVFIRDCGWIPVEFDVYVVVGYTLDPGGDPVYTSVDCDIYRFRICHDWFGRTTARLVKNTNLSYGFVAYRNFHKERWLIRTPGPLKYDDGVEPVEIKKP